MFSCSEINIELQFVTNCVTCDRVLGDAYRKLLKSGVDHKQILLELGIRDQCCLASLGVDCHRRYQDSLIKEACITTGSSPLITVTDFADTVEPPKPRKLVTDTGTAIETPVPMIFEEVIRQLTTDV